MPICSGCSKNFPHMQGDRCQLCARRTSTEPTQCIDCGLVYDCLSDDTCQSCSDKRFEHGAFHGQFKLDVNSLTMGNGILGEGLGAVVKQAIVNAPDPRRTNPQLVPQFTHRGPPTPQVQYNILLRAAISNKARRRLTRLTK